jgi:hypothetical protein
VCARFVALFRMMGLLTQARVAIDDSKFKAANNRDKNFTRTKIDRRMAQIEDSVARYVQQLDTADRRPHWNFSQAMRLTSGLNPRWGISQPCELARAETAPQKYVSAGSSGPP